MSDTLSELYRQHYGQTLATITRIVGDISTAEDLVQDSFVKASQWPTDSIPTNPAAWLMQTAKNSAIDHLRRNNRWSSKAQQIEDSEEQTQDQEPDWDQHPALQDDMLRLIFTCCHPALNQEAQIALCLNTVCGLTTDEIAKAFITPSATMSQRLWRAKTKIKQAGISYQVPEATELPARLNSVANVIYLIFNEGWLASGGDQPLRQDLLHTAILSAQTLIEAIPTAFEIRGLLALMVLQNSRRDTRFDDQGQLITLPDQDRSQWHSDEIRQAFSSLHKLFESGHGQNRYAIMAAIAAEHSRAPSTELTNWVEIATLYEALMALDDSPVIRLNFAIAVAERDGAAMALKYVDELGESLVMQRYHLFHSTRAVLLKRLDQKAQAKMAYLTAKSLTVNKAEQNFLQSQISSLYI